MIYDSIFFSNLFIATAQTEKARRSYAGGISVGEGHIPYDTGRTQSSIRLTRASKTRCTVEIGGEVAPYDIYLQYAENVANTSVPNRHRGFVGRFARAEFVEALRREFPKVKVR